MTDVFDCKASPAKERMTSDWEAGGKHVDYKREKDPVDRREAEKLGNVFRRKVGLVVREKSRTLTVPSPPPPPPPEVTVAVRSTDKGSDSIYCRFRRGLAENYFPASGTCKALTLVDCFINDYVLCQWFANYWHRESPKVHPLTI